MSFVLNTFFAILLIFVFCFIYKKTPFYDKSVFWSICAFIILSVFMGKALNFYSVIPNWDKILHFISGFVSVNFGKVLYKKLSGDTKKKMLQRVFALSIAFSVAALWEIWEFSCDAIFSTNTQNASLSDTMADIIYACLAALIYIFIKA